MSEANTIPARPRPAAAKPAAAPGAAAPKTQAAPPTAPDQAEVVWDKGDHKARIHVGTVLGRVTSVSGSSVLGLLDAEVIDSAEIGAVVRMRSSAGRCFGIITTLRSEGRRRGSEDERRWAEVHLLGEIPEMHGSKRFRRGVSSHPRLDAEICTATAEELRTIYARPDADTVRLGTLRQAVELPAFGMTDELLGKHFAVLGTTGAGKSCTVTVILRAILAAHPFGHVIVIDPHNEYRRSFAGHAELIDPRHLKLPFWLLNFEEIASILVNQDSPSQAYAEKVILKRAILTAKQTYHGLDDDYEHITVDTPVPYRLSELMRALNDSMGAFNKPENSAPYLHLINRIEGLSSDKRYEFMFTSFRVHDNMADVLSQLLRIPVNGKPMTIIDVSGVPSEIVDVVVSVISRLIFEFALWSERRHTPPILLVCEEAHRYMPRDEESGFAPTQRAIGRIAKEGRKYGLGLCLVTQRPAELSVSSLSQCNTIFALRLSNEHDLEFVRSAVPDSSKWLVDALPALNTQEALVLGDGVSVPMHVRFDDLAPGHQPASSNPPFADAWQQEQGGVELIRATVERWRRQIRE